MEQLTQLKPSRPSSFDPHHPPDTALIDDCVHCGFCLPACPTYVLWGEEMDSPRGRIYMMKKSTQGEAPLDQRFRLHMDNCLGCMACMTACPSGVQYDKLIEDTRAQVERNIPRSTCRSSHAPLSALRPAASRPRHRRSTASSKAHGRNGIASPTGSCQLVPTSANPCCFDDCSAAPCWHALRLCPAGILPARQRPLNRPTWTPSLLMLRDAVRQ